MAWGSISLFGGFLENENSLETQIVIFENVSPKGSFWLKMSISKFQFWRRILDIYRQPLLICQLNAPSTRPPPLFPRPGKDKGKMTEIRYVRTFIWKEIRESVLWAW